MSNRFYAGVGSRETPIYIMYLMSELAVIFEKKGYILRSGCATGADAAFEDALENPNLNAEIYVPNKGFPFKMGTYYKKHYLIPEEIHGRGIDGLYSKATRMIHSQNIHKAWQRCPPYAMKLHNRNMFQVLGQDLKTPARFVICYTKGKEQKYEDTHSKTGGTGTAINAASLNNVDVFNLSVDEHYVRIRKFIEDNKELINYKKLNKIIARTEKYNVRDKHDKFTKSYENLMDIILKEKEKREKKLSKELREELYTSVVEKTKKPVQNNKNSYK